MKNEVYLDFIIADFEDVTHDEITKTLDINPAWVHVKEEKRNLKFAIISKNNVWAMSSGLEGHTSFEDQMNAMLDIIESKIDLFRPCWRGRAARARVKQAINLGMCIGIDLIYQRKEACVVLKSSALM